MTLRAILQAAKVKLSAVTDCPSLEAELLLAHLLKQSRAYLLTHIDDELSAEVHHAMMIALDRRASGEPMAYITGQRDFWSMTLQVTVDTLIPRPETETLVEMVLECFPEKNTKKRLADLGTGSGAIALAIATERPAWEIVATDVSQSALDIAKNNAQRLELGCISFRQGNWCTALPMRSDADRFDVIVSNPPYIAESEWQTYASGLLFEPRAALVAGSDGLDAVREILAHAKSYLVAQGCLLIEHGYAQGEAVRELFRETGFHEVVTRCDLSGQERVTMGVN